MEKEVYTKKWGDRRDAKKIKMPGMMRLATYIKDREDADVYINKKIDVTELVEYMKKKKEVEPETTFFHAFSMACAKVVYNRPKLNRYIVNHTCYERHDILLSFVAKVNFDDEAKELISLFKAEPNDTIDDIRKKIKEKVERVRNNIQNDTDNSLDILDKLPRWALTWFVAPIAKWLDRHDLLPGSLYNDLIYNSTVILSNLGSIKCGAIYHNLTNFGSNSIVMTIGDIHKEALVNKDGKVEVRDVVDFGINLDERIADGVYFAKAVNLLEYILKHPTLLDNPVNEIIKEKKDFEY